MKLKLVAVLLTAFIGLSASSVFAAEAVLRRGVWTTTTVTSGSATVAVTIPGLKSTDAVVATVNTTLTTASLKNVLVGDNVATVTLTAACDTAAKVSILVLR